MTPYIIGFAAVCIILGIGLQRRAAWMWYAGWVLLYLFAGYDGTFFFSALYRAETSAQEASACIYLAGGLLLWMPVTIWWATHRHFFGTRSTPPLSRDDPKIPD